MIFASVNSNRDRPPSDIIAELKYHLSNTPLDPECEFTGNFVRETGGFYDPFSEMGDKSILFSGDFLEIPFSFSIRTNEPDLVKELEKCIRENQTRPDYKKARKIFYHKRGLTKEEWKSSFVFHAKKTANPALAHDTVIDYYADKFHRDNHHYKPPKDAAFFANVEHKYGYGAWEKQKQKKRNDDRSR